MQRKLKVILSVLCVLMVALFSDTAVIAAATTNLPSSFLIGDQDGIHVDPTGLYCIDARELDAGDVITKTLIIQNVGQAGGGSEAKTPYMLSMRAEPLSSSGPIDLLDAVQLELKLDGQLIYSGRCRGDEDTDMIQNALNLGTYSAGDQRVLDITLTVDPNMALSDEASEADFRWTFYAHRDASAAAPTTGDDGYRAYVLIGGVVLPCALLLLLLEKKRHNKQAGMN